jgi:tRNA(Ile)-lysidine synthase
LYEKLKSQILPQLIPPHSRVLVAISGGPDSVALGHILWRYANEVKDQKLSLVFTHVHHGVRRESDEEETMVRDLAREWEIPCVVHHFDAKSYAKLTGQSFQTAAREWRYARWKEDMVRENCTLLATAHHLGDQAETVLYRLVRGSGTAGLAGIYPKKGDIIRPLLSVSKENIFKYCEEEQLPFAMDQSNEEPVYVRNKIRLELLPILERDYNPRILEALGRLSELVRWDEEYLSTVSEEVWQKYTLESSRAQVGIKREAFQEPKAILSRLIRRAAGQISGEPRGIGYLYVGQIMNSEGMVGWRQDLPGFSVHIDYEAIWFTRTNDIKKQVTAPWSHPVIYNDWVHWKDKKGQERKVGLFDKAADGSNPERMMKESSGQRTECLEEVYFNYEQLEEFMGTLVWRTRLPGDRMWFKGIGHKSLKKLFQEGKISEDERETYPLLASGNEILWIPGVRVGDLCRGRSGESVIGRMHRC